MSKKKLAARIEALEVEVAMLRAQQYVQPILVQPLPPSYPYTRPQITCETITTTSGAPLKFTTTNQ